MSAIDKKTDELFMAATLSDDSLGYPDDVAFVPGDQDWADEVVWRNLADECRATVVVDDETELMLIPFPRSIVDRLRGCVRVRVTHRPHGHIAAYATSSTLGRHPVREMRDLAHAQGGHYDSSAVGRTAPMSEHIERIYRRLSLTRS